MRIAIETKPISKGSPNRGDLDGAYTTRKNLEWDAHNGLWVNMGISNKVSPTGENLKRAYA